MTNNNHLMPFGSIMNALQGQLTPENWEEICDRVMLWCKDNVPDEPFPSRPLPETKVCPKCGESMNRIPAGTSKTTGKPYNAFWSCPGCKETVNDKHLWRER